MMYLWFLTKFEFELFTCQKVREIQNWHIYEKRKKLIQIHFCALCNFNLFIHEEFTLMLEDQEKDQTLGQQNPFIPSWIGIQLFPKLADDPYNNISFILNLN